MEKRYSMLRIIAGILKLLGIIFVTLALLSLVISVINVFIGMGSGRGFSLALPAMGLLAGLPLTVAGLVTALVTYAFGELIELLIAMEENSRATTRLLSSIRSIQLETYYRSQDAQKR